MSIFTIYTKTLSPAHSPALAPLQSPVLGPTSIPSLSLDKIEDNGKEDIADNGTTVSGVAFMGSMLLCDCCNQRCSNKPKPTIKPPTAAAAAAAAAMDPDFALLDHYASGSISHHATHYTYNASTPRLVSDFDININNPISVFLDIPSSITNLH